MLSWPCLMLEGFFPKWQSFSPWSCSFRNHFLSSYCKPENSPARVDQWCDSYILRRWKKVNQVKRRGLCPHFLPRLSPSPAQRQPVYVLGDCWGDGWVWCWPASPGAQAAPAPNSCHLLPSSWPAKSASQGGGAGKAHLTLRLPCSREWPRDLTPAMEGGKPGEQLLSHIADKKTQMLGGSPSPASF